MSKEKIMAEYESRVAGYEADAKAATERTDKELIAISAGRFADQLDAAQWTDEDCRRQGTSLAHRVRQVERSLLG